MRIHIGKRPPKGYRELPGSFHIGRGVWVMHIEPINAAPQGTAEEGQQNAACQPSADGQVTASLPAGAAPDQQLPQECMGRKE